MRDKYGNKEGHCRSNATVPFFAIKSLKADAVH